MANITCILRFQVLGGVFQLFTLHYIPLFPQILNYLLLYNTLHCIFFRVFSATPDIWSSIVAGRKPSFSDVNFPKPKHVPGTTMTLHSASPQFPWQQGNNPGMRKSTSTPGSMSSGSYQSQGQKSPGQASFSWFQEGQGHIGSDNSGQGHSQGSHSPAELLTPSQYSRVSEQIVEEREGSRSPSMDALRDNLKTKVTFSLTDSASSKSTESGFSENVGKPETYASVCTNCKAAMAELDAKQKALHPSTQDRDGRARSHSFGDRPSSGSCDECFRQSNDQRPRHKDSDQRNLHHRNRNSPRGGGYYHGNSNQNKSYRDEGHYYHKDGNFHPGQGQGRSNRRGYRGGYRGNRGKRDFYHHYDNIHQKDHSSEPLFGVSDDNDNRHIRRAVSSPDKTYDKSHTEFSYDHVESNDKSNSTHRNRSDYTHRHSIGQERHRENRAPKLTTPQIYVAAEGRSPSSGDSEETQWINVEHKSTRKRHDSESSRDSGSSQQPHRGNNRGYYRGRGSRSMEKYDGRHDQFRERSNSDRTWSHRGQAGGDRGANYRGRGRGGQDGYNRGHGERDWHYRGRGRDEGSGSYRGQGYERNSLHLP